LINNKPINIFEDGLESRDFVYIDDVVNATIAAMKSDLDNCFSVNVGTGIPTSVLTVAETLKTMYQSDSDITITGNYRLGDIRHNIADIILLREKLKCNPGIRFNDGIERFSEWVKGQEIDNLNLGYENSLAEMKRKGLYR
jgi:dTDP-L-rhamnose 4-epimerase